jgi:hypothetical protein
MALPTVTQTWTTSFNNRYTFVSVLGAMQSYMLSLKNFLKTTMGFTVKGSCSAGTGAMDGVDRWTVATDVAPRNNGAAGSQAWFVLTDGAGVNWCFSFNSASDDIFRLAHSTGGNYVAAGTANQQPTATDECFDAASGSWVNATASADRVWHMWGSSDKKMWRSAVMRSSALVMYQAGEKFTSALVSPATFTLGIGGGTVGAIKSFYNGTTFNSNFNATYAPSTLGDLCRVHTNQDINATASIGGEMPGGSVGSLASSAVLFNAELPLLQGATGELMFPAQMGSRLANADGKLGSKIDSWYVLTNSTTVPGLVDTFGTLQFVVVQIGGAIILPGDGVTTPVAA